MVVVRSAHGGCVELLRYKFGFGAGGCMGFYGLSQGFEKVIRCRCVL